MRCRRLIHIVQQCHLWPFPSVSSIMVLHANNAAPMAGSTLEYQRHHQVIHIFALSKEMDYRTVLSAITGKGKANLWSYRASPWVGLQNRFSNFISYIPPVVGFKDPANHNNGESTIFICNNYRPNINIARRYMKQLLPS